jgi:hypothetical protein
MGALSEHFASEGPGRETEWARQRRWFIKARHDHQRRGEIADKLDDGVAALSAAISVASEIQITEFRAKLDTYDSATVEALMENQQLLDAVNERIEAMLERAHVLEDGRRVFRTEDGTQVFDEQGSEVSADELDPNVIAATAPTWEAFSAEVMQRDALVQQRTEILDYQEQLDAARDQIAEGEISEADLEALDADLLDAMPDAVRTYAGIEPSAPEIDLTTQFKGPANVLPVQSQSPAISAQTPAPFQ